MVGIYKITSPSGKIYIGQSWNIKQRFSRYKRLLCKDQYRLYNSLLKYGVENHDFKIIHELPKDVEQCILDTYEILYISKYKSSGCEMLNLKEGGSNGKHSDETKSRIKERTKGKNIGNKKWVGKKHSQESIEKMRKSQTGVIPWNKGKSLSEEHKRNLSESKKGKSWNGDKEAVRKRMMGNKYSVKVKEFA